jgi:hypothetical protein
MSVILTFNSAVTSLTDFNEENYSVTGIPKILLLYPRDCEWFMKMMVTFRDLLEEMTTYKVRTYLTFALNTSAAHTVSSNIFKQMM